MGELLGESLKTAEWVKEFGLKSFIESGCYLGTGLEFAHSLGLTCYSCDINSDYVDIAKAKVPEATVLVGESTVCFKEILPQVTEPTLFWLDAHMPHAYARPKLFTPVNNWPLFDELVLVKELKPNYQYDVIILDDVRNIKAEDNDFFAAGGFPEFVIPGEGHLLAEYYSVLEDTHEVIFIREGTGSLVYLPKVTRVNA